MKFYDPKDIQIKIDGHEIDVDGSVIDFRDSNMYPDKGITITIEIKDPKKIKELRKKLGINSCGMVKNSARSSQL